MNKKRTITIVVVALAVLASLGIGMHIAANTDLGAVIKSLHGGA